MKRDLILSSVIAVAVHLFVLSMPLPKGAGRAWNAYRAVEVSVIHPKKAIASPSPPESPAEVGLKSLFKPSPEDLLRQKTIHKPGPSENKITAQPSITKEVVRVNRLKDVTKHALGRGSASQNKSLQEPSMSLGPEVPDQEIESLASVKTVSIPTGAVDHRRKGLGDGIVTYAMPRYKENPPPNYPRVARTRGYEGRTLLRVEVFETGKVGRIEITTSSGFEILDTAALKSVKKWTFVPGTKNGKKIRQWVMVPVRFDLR